MNLTVLGIPEIVTRARRNITELTGQPIASVVACNGGDAGWKVTLETLERKAIPDTGDLLATYVITLNEAGDLVNFHRLRVRRRGEPVEEEAR
ncbi:MAG: gas vesicle protein [Chloroflexi bacterium]|nr:gas vesicle protein [Chloroflexota bacterium]